MVLNFVPNYWNILTILVTIVLIFELTTANQLEVAKKYGKRFGNKNKANTTEPKENETKSVTKSIALEITKGLNNLPKTTTTEPSITRQKHRQPTTSGTTSSPVPTTAAPKAEDQEEVDVDLSQLQVSLPNVKFDCTSRTEGYYGDPDYRCEVFHYCSAGGKRDTFLCPSNSKFNQKDMTCDTDALEDLCVSEPVWGQNHLYPTQTSPPLSSASPHELNVNQNKNKEKVQIEVTAPKYETNDNGFREPVYDSKTLDNQRRGNSNTKTTAITTHYVDSKTTANNNYNDNNEGNSEDKSNNYSNNEPSVHNYNNNNNKDLKFNYFGGNFGERQRNPGLDGMSAGTANTLSAVNDRKSSQTNYNNNFNINNNNNDKSIQHISTDFGTVIEANKKGYKEDNGNSNRVTSHQPVLSHSTSDSNQYSTNNKQSFTPNSYPFDRLNGNKDVNSIRNSNKNSYESSRSEPHLQSIPSATPDKSYLSPPLATEKLSSVAPPKAHQTSRYRAQESPVRQLAPPLPTRPAIKWPNKKHSSDFYVTERIRNEITILTTPTPPPVPTTQAIRYYRPPVVEILPQKNDVTYELSVDPWPQQEADNYEPTKYSNPSQNGQQASQPIQSEHMEIQHINWSPINQNGNTFTVNKQNQNKLTQKQTTKAPAYGQTYKTWNHLELQPQPPQKEHYFVNQEPAYTYPPIHHTIGPSGNHIWSDEKSQQKEEYNPHKDPINTMSAQSLKPKWAQEVSEMEVIPHYQTMALQSQPLVSQQSHPQRIEDYNSKPKPKVNSEINSPKPPNPDSQRFGHTFKDFDLNFNDFYTTYNPSVKTTQFYDTPKGGTGYEGHQPMARPQQMNFFYEQFKPYKFSANTPTESVKKLTENEKLLIKHSLSAEELTQQKENSKTNTKGNNNKNILLNENNNNFKQQTQQQINSPKPAFIDDMKFEKEMSGAKLAGYVPEMIGEEEFPLGVPETRFIPKLHKTVNKPKQSLKHNPNRYKPSKPQFVSTIFDELLAGENSWALKHLDTSGLETAFSHNYPVLPLTLPNRPQKGQKFGQQHNPGYPMLALAPNRLQMPAPLPQRLPQAPVPQPAIFLPHLPFAHQFQAQASMPFPYYLPFYPTPQQTFKPKRKQMKFRPKTAKSY